jgi:hypothetical protein
MSGHEPQMGLDTKTYWLTERQSQCDFDFDFEFSSVPNEESSRWGSQFQMTRLEWSDSFGSITSDK